MRYVFMFACFLLVILLFFIFGIIMMNVYADGLGAGISTVGSPHNFVDNVGMDELPPIGWNNREEICHVCHVPHNSNYANEGILWNHELSSAILPMYSSPSLDGNMANQPTGTSKMCLSCHDGTVAIDSFSTFMSDYNGDTISDLSKSHPISIEYNETLDPELRPKTSQFGGGTIEDVLENGTIVQCSSCHDVHDAPGESIPGTHLLRLSQKASDGQASGLCLACHIK